jgi:D-amino-acid dehydrogenase
MAKNGKGPASDVAIIGAGIIGLACAWHLVEAGRRVTLIDRQGIALGASFGNAGALAFSDVLPMATSGVWRKLPGWLLDPLGPLTIPPAYLPQIAPWLLRFWRAGRPDRVAASIAAQSAMMRLASSEMAALVSAAGLATMVRQDGALELYESEAELRASLPGWAARQNEGIKFEHLRGAELAALQPGLSPRFVAGTFVPAWQSVADPFQFAVALGDKVLARGATFLKGEVVAAAPVEGGVLVTLADGSTLTAQKLVIAGGAWSKRLSAPLGDAVPLETERGYNTTLPPGAFDLKRQLTVGGHGFVVTPLSTGIRVGGAVELGGLALPPNFARADAMLKKAALFLPGLDTGGGKQWMGFRPSMPDSLPVIGRSTASPDILYAFGHGHLGLTQSAATGRLVTDLVTGASSRIDLFPFSPQRF